MQAITISTKHILSAILFKCLIWFPVDHITSVKMVANCLPAV